jgi:hypothetical protein
MEFNIYDLLKAMLDPGEWQVTKPDLNAQPGAPDTDVSVRHLLTGIELNVEVKSAVRTSMSTGKRSKKLRVPHFKVKCHRSRSNMELAGKGNDSYRADAFDLLFANPSNAVFKKGGGGTSKNVARAVAADVVDEIDAEVPDQVVMDLAEAIVEMFVDNEAEDLGPMEVVDQPEIKKLLYGHYEVTDDKALLAALDVDYRCVLPGDIAENGLIPRTPYVQLQGDPNWASLSDLPRMLEEAVRRKKSN